MVRPAAESQMQPLHQRRVQGGRILLHDQHEAPVRRKARGETSIRCGGQDDQRLFRKCGRQDKQRRRQSTIIPTRYAMPIVSEAADDRMCCRSVGTLNVASLVTVSSCGRMKAPREK